MVRVDSVCSAPDLLRVLEVQSGEVRQPGPTVNRPEARRSAIDGIAGALCRSCRRSSLRSIPARAERQRADRSRKRAAWPATLSFAMNDPSFDHASDRAFAQLAAVDGDLLRLDEVARTIVVIYSAQGVIDNGGLRAFFGGDWPGVPPYAMHADAYRRIGAIASAEAIEEAADMFALEAPERHAALRSLALQGAVGARIDALALTDGEEVWRLLAHYVERQAPAS